MHHLYRLNLENLDCLEIRLVLGDLEDLEAPPVVQEVLGNQVVLEVLVVLDNHEDQDNLVVLDPQDNLVVLEDLGNLEDLEDRVLHIFDLGCTDCH